MDARQSPLGVATRKSGKGSDGRSGGRGRYVRDRREGERDQGQEIGWGGGEGAYEMGDSVGTATDGIPES